MYYKITRTYLTNAGGDSEQQSDKTPYLVPAADAPAAATAFVAAEGARLLGSASAFTGDKATATAWVDGRLYIIFAERAAEAMKAAATGDEAKPPI